MAEGSSKWDLVPQYFIAAMAGLHSAAECILLAYYARRELDVQGNSAAPLLAGTLLHIVIGILLAIDLGRLYIFSNPKHHCRFRILTTVLFGIHVTCTLIAFIAHPSYVTNSLLMTWIWIWWTIYIVSGSFGFLYVCWWFFCWLPSDCDRPPSAPEPRRHRHHHQRSSDAILPEQITSSKTTTPIIAARSIIVLSPVSNNTPPTSMFTTPSPANRRLLVNSPPMTNNTSPPNVSSTNKQQVLSPTLSLSNIALSNIVVQ